MSLSESKENTQKKYRIIFAGTPEFAADHLAALLNTDHEVVAVYSQPDRPAGRGNKLHASAVKLLALEHQIDVYQPESFKEVDALENLTALNADIMIVVAYGLLLPLPILNAPKLGCINVHGSLLPRWRGAAPIQRSIWAGDAETGVAIMQMDVGLDTGDVIHQISTPISRDETSASLYTKLAKLGPVALLEALDQIFDGTAIAKPQSEEQTSYAKKLSKAEALIDWQLPASTLERCVRAFNPWPVSYFSFEGGNYKVWQSQILELEQTEAPPGTIIRAEKAGLDIATANGVLRITQLQPPGKKAMSVSDLLNSRRELFQVGKVLISQ